MLLLFDLVLSFNFEELYVEFVTHLAGNIDDIMNLGNDCDDEQNVQARLLNKFRRVECQDEDANDGAVSGHHV